MLCYFYKHTWFRNQHVFAFKQQAGLNLIFFNDLYIIFLFCCWNLHPSFFVSWWFSNQKTNSADHADALYIYSMVIVLNVSVIDNIIEIWLVMWCWSNFCSSLHIKYNKWVVKDSNLSQLFPLSKFGTKIQNQSPANVNDLLMDQLNNSW